jgi:CheY-like chemotaxis protein
VENSGVFVLREDRIGTKTFLDPHISCAKNLEMSTPQKTRGMLGLDKKNLPIIALTSNGTDEDQIKSLKTGMNAHITKPF